MTPRVSFVVPCYKHGHFLAECVHSILQQSFEDFEILVMDDCSPDSTPEVARTLADPRVLHVRNERNLGHIANYNKGIGLARGEFIWLINVDDYLGKPYVLERFVAALDAAPAASYVFCPALVVPHSPAHPPHGVNGTRDRVFSGTEFLERLVVENRVPTPAVMVRKSSYDVVGLYPPELPVAGDWFQWCRHTFCGDVVYLAEPMVCYRLHDSNMSKAHIANPAPQIADEVAVRWRARDMAQRLGRPAVARAALEAIAADYARRVALHVTERWRFGMTLDAFDRSLLDHCHDVRTRAWVRAKVYGFVADTFYAEGDRAMARRYYEMAQRERPFDATLRAKRALLETGSAGRAVRSAVARIGHGRPSAS